MALKKVDVVSPGSVESGEGELIPVYFGYDLKKSEDFEFLLKNSPEYILCAIFRKNNQTLCMFGKARRHQELEQAIINDQGKIDDYSYGQNERGKTDNYDYGQLTHSDTKIISNLHLNHPPGKSDKENERELLSFFKLINSDFLDECVIVRWNNKNRYLYKSDTETLEQLGQKNVVSVNAK